MPEGAVAEPPMGAASPMPAPPAAALAAEARVRKGPRELDTICASPTSACSPQIALIVALAARACTGQMDGGKLNATA